MATVKQTRKSEKSQKKRKKDKQIQDPVIIIKPTGTRVRGTSMTGTLEVTCNEGSFSSPSATRPYKYTYGSAGMRIYSVTVGSTQGTRPHRMVFFSDDGDCQIDIEYRR